MKQIDIDLFYKVYKTHHGHQQLPRAEVPLKKRKIN